jgi:hypothetical protein
VPAELLVWFVLALGLFCRDCYRQVFRWLRPFVCDGVPGRSTLCEARRRLGVRPLVLLAREVIELQATPATPEAFYQGLRLMALDGLVLDVPDSAANDRVFGRTTGSRGHAAFPQVRVLALCEVGTHVFWRFFAKPVRVSEQALTPLLLRHLSADMLLLWDRNFLSYERVRQVGQRGAHLLARISKNPVFEVIERLADGSYRGRLYPTPESRKARRGGIPVRIIEYTFSDPHRPGTGVRHRLLTTLLDAQRCPAPELIELYHQRWEEELSIDELKVHQMERPTFRSQTPAGVIQELHALLLDHYVIRVLMAEAAGPLAPRRMSFTATLKILRCRIPECPSTPAGQHRWLHQLLTEISQEILPPRRNRINPRVIKRKMSKWKKKRPLHYLYPQPTHTFRQSIVLLR